MKIAVFVSGRGSNLEAILNSPKYGELFRVSLVFSDKSECKAFEIARKYSISSYSIGNKEGSKSYDEVIKIITDTKIDLIVLAGFLKLIPEKLVNLYSGRIINIHPALLPSFGGPGMYGMNVHSAVFNSSCKVSGPTVHFVDNSYDTGKIIAQKAIDINDVQSPEEIAERVLQVEHQILPFVVEKIAEGKIKEVNNRIIIEN
ncbi:MAG TPA: phosphoribosylglycinamide formyltransferase [Ignavibacteriaceae bacterium]|nr:phosphoribosylglycinamide formyltransferase [Ignavibacteriaceae bacterium]